MCHSQSRKKIIFIFLKLYIKVFKNEKQSEYMLFKRSEHQLLIMVLEYFISVIIYLTQILHYI